MPAMTHPPDAPLETSLWTEFRDLLRSTALLWGEPASLWADRVQLRSEVRTLRAWIRALEAAARALLLVMAARLPKAAPSRSRQTPRSAPPASLIDQSADEQPISANPIRDGEDGSERWGRVTFHVAPPAPRRAEERRGGVHREPWRFLPVRALAFRFEALIRVATDPGPYARRLARRIAPGVVRRALQSPKGEPGRRPPYEDFVAAAQALAQEALETRKPETG
jgi:hypothetical protein